MMELEDSVLVADPQLEISMRRLREEERLLREQQAAMEASGNTDDIAALEHQDLLRHNQLRQQELLKQQAKLAKRATRPDEHRCELRRRPGALAIAAHGAPAPAHGAAHGSAFGVGYGSGVGTMYGIAPGTVYGPGHVAGCGATHGGVTCNVRVNQLHGAAAEALETDV